MLFGDVCVLVYGYIGVVECFLYVCFCGVVFCECVQLCWVFQICQVQCFVCVGFVYGFLCCFGELYVWYWFGKVVEYDDCVLCGGVGDEDG